MGKEDQQTNSNGSPVTQREFGRLRQDIKDNLVEIKAQTLRLEKKLDHISSTELPGLKVSNEHISIKTKLLWAALMVAIAIALDLFVPVLKALVS